jgi:hypothetical protein
MRCGQCGGKLGLIVHRYWELRFCRRACKRSYLEHVERDSERLRRWFAYLAPGHSESQARRRAPRKIDPSMEDQFLKESAAWSE